MGYLRQLSPRGKFMRMTHVLAAVTLSASLLASGYQQSYAHSQLDAERMPSSARSATFQAGLCTFVHADPESMPDDSADPEAGRNPDIVFEGIPADEILPEGQIAPGAESDSDVLIGPADEPFASPARQSCLRSCDRYYFNVLTPACGRVRNIFARRLCRERAAEEYASCRRSCPRR